MRVAVRDGLLNVSHGNGTLLTRTTLPGWRDGGFDHRWRIGVLGVAIAPEDGAPLAGTHTLHELDVRDANSGGYTRTPTVGFAVAVNAQQFSRDGNLFPPP